MNAARITTATLIALTAALASCGGDDEKSGPAIKEGGQLTGYFAEEPDSLDPALAFISNAQTALWTSYTPLLTYPRKGGAAGAEVVPGAATDLPKVNPEGTEYELTLRKGITYSDGSAVKANDFEHAVKRLILLESPGVSYYLGIDGAEDFGKKGKLSGDISGIAANDETGRIKIRLAAPDFQFKYKLALTYAALVPQTVKAEEVKDEAIPGYGPMQIVDIGAKGNGSFSLVKNAAFKASETVPTAKPDRIDISVVENQRRQAQDVLAGKVDFLNDPPPPDQLRILRDQAKGRYGEFTTNSTYYFVLNVDAKPFDNEKVRQAVATAIDERALARLQGGLLEPSCNFLPPGMVGYKRIDPCPYGAVTADPDIAKAKALIDEAGVTGDKVKVWSDDGGPAPKTAEYLADVLNQIGLKAEPNVLDPDSFYESVSDRSTDAQISVFNWFQDFPHPSSFFANVDGANITDTFNLNIGNANDPELNKLIKDGAAKANVEDAKDIYAQADNLVATKAYLVPYGHRKLTVVTSPRVAFDNVIFSPVYSLDFGSLALKAESESK